MSLAILITGFGPFRGHGAHPRIDDNPSRAIAFALERDPPAGTRVRAAELPVTFLGAPAAIDALFAGTSERPALLLGLGVISRGGGYRLERRARGRLAGERPDQDGRTASELAIDAGPDRGTGLALEPLADAMRGAGAPAVEISSDAGAYVCERSYHALLGWGEKLAVPALFVHIPPVHELDVEQQTAIVRALVEALAREVP